MSLPIPQSLLDAHSAILGKTGAGKSSLLRVVVEDLLRRDKRVCIVDPKGDWYGVKLSADGKSPAYPVITFGNFVEDNATDVPINEHSGKHVAELISSGNRPCVIGFRGWMPGKMTRFWIDFASTLFNSKSGELYVVIDECHNFAPKGRVMDPESGKCLHWTNRLGKCEREILANLINVYPGGLTSIDLASNTGYSANSGGFNNALSRLRTLELITRGQPIMASEEFFQ